MRSRATPFLSGELVTLVPLTEKHCEGAYPEWLNDPEVCRFNSHHVYPYTLAQAIDYVRSVQRDDRSLVLAIELRDTATHVGNIALQQIDHRNRSAEFAILLGDKNSWGRGIAREASLLLVRHGFEALNLHRVYCGTSAENIPMQKLAARLGMREEGRRREAFFKNGRYMDMLEFGVLSGEFLEQLGSQRRGTT